MRACAYCGTDVPDTDATYCPSCSMPLEGPGLFLCEGSQLQGGKYAIEAVLGQGGFGITYRAVQTNLGSRVAIKELFPDGATRVRDSVQLQGSTRLAAFAEQKRAFIQEAQTVARFHCPGIVRVQDVFEENGTAYMVMEFLDGTTLAERLAVEGALAVGEVEGLANDLSSALAVVHGGRFLHRDIKPENVFLANDGRTVLIDFGSARDFRSGATMQHTRLITPGYAPLEQYAAQAKFGPYTDLYALAGTLYHCLVGEAPPSAPDRTTGAALAPLPSSLPPGLRAAIERSLEVRIEDRPQNVDAFVALIEGRMDGVGRSGAPRSTTSTTDVPRDSGDPTSRGDMVVCGKCGESVSQASGACWRCGWPLPPVATSAAPTPAQAQDDGACPSCGMAVSSHARTCWHCGHALGLGITAPASGMVGPQLGDATSTRRVYGSEMVGVLFVLAAFGAFYGLAWFASLDDPSGRLVDGLRNRLSASPFCRVVGIRSTPLCHASGGAVATHRSDESTSWLDALRDGSGVVSLRDGSYVVEETLRLMGNITLEGNGVASTTVRVRGSGAALHYEGGGTLRVRDVTLELGSGATGSVLSITGGRFELTNVVITGGRESEGGPGAGLYVGGDATGILRSCTLQANDMGLIVTARAAPLVEECDIIDNVRRGVSFHDRASGELRASLIARNGFAQARDDFWQGIALEDEASPTIIGNVIRDNAGVGIQYRDASGGIARDNVLEKNGWNIEAYGPSGASAGGIAVGVAGSDDRPGPIVEENNRYEANFGGGLRDYR